MSLTCEVEKNIVSTITEMKDTASSAASSQRPSLRN